MTKIVAIWGITITLLTGCSKGRSMGDQKRDEKMGTDPSTYLISQQSSTSVPELYSKAKDLLAKNDIANARRLYQAALSREPNNPAGYIGLAACAMREEQTQQARQYYDKAAALDANSVAAQLGLGSVAYLEGRFQDAVVAYERAISLDSSNADAHWGAAVAHNALHDRIKSREHAARFLALAPESALAPRARQLLSP